MIKIGSRTVSLRLCEQKLCSHAACSLLSPPLARYSGRDRRDPVTTRPKATARLQQAALNQMPRCTADECASILPGQFSFGPDFDAELPAVPAPQRVMLHPHHSCTYRPASRELLAYPWWPCASTRTVKPQESKQKNAQKDVRQPNVAPLCLIFT
jgi:hypothetical protein